MHINAVDAVFEEQFDRVRKLALTKGKDYTDGSDRFSNFKKHAQGLGLTPYQVWAVYANKHWDAINSFVRNGGQLESEPIETRIDDVITYLCLLRGMIEEEYVKSTITPATGNTESA